MGAQGLEKGYKDHAVAFIDILGFSEFVRESNDNQERASDLLQILKKLKDIEESSFVKATAFSDNIVLSVQVNENHGDGITWLIHELILLQNILLNSGFIVRGGVTIGKLYHENGVVLGPGLISAYKLESKVSFYPRILVDHIIYNYPSSNVTKGNNSHLDEDSKAFRFAAYPWEQFISVDNDGQYFVDFLSGSYVINNYSEGSRYWKLQKPEEIIVYFEKVKSLIERNIVANIDDIRKAQIWRWLGSYYNLSIKRLYDLGLHEVNLNLCFDPTTPKAKEAVNPAHLLIDLDLKREQIKVKKDKPLEKALFLELIEIEDEYKGHYFLKEFFPEPNLSLENVILGLKQKIPKILTNEKEMFFLKILFKDAYEFSFSPFELVQEIYVDQLGKCFDYKSIDNRLIVDCIGIRGQNHPRLTLLGLNIAHKEFQLFAKAIYFYIFLKQVIDTKNENLKKIF